MIERIDFDPPVEPGINCRYCYDPLVVVAEIRDGWGTGDDGHVLAPYPMLDWRHKAKLKRGCRPVMHAEAPDYYKAVALVRAALAAASRRPRTTSATPAAHASTRRLHRPARGRGRERRPGRIARQGRHGTLTGFSYGCRCERCAQASKDYHRRQADWAVRRAWW